MHFFDLLQKGAREHAIQIKLPLPTQRASVENVFDKLQSKKTRICFPRLNNKRRIHQIMNPESNRVHWPPPPPPTTSTTNNNNNPVQFHSYNPHNQRNPFLPMSQPQSQQSQSPPSFPPGAGPNDTGGHQPTHYPSGHAYRRSQSNSPFRHTVHPTPYPLPSAQPNLPPIQHPSMSGSQPELKQESYYTPTSAELYTHAQVLASGAGEGSVSTHYSSVPSITRLPPILQVEKKQVTTSATQAASASRRRNEAHFACPVPGCGSTFTRRFNLRGAHSRTICISVFCNSPFPLPAGHLRSHTEERPYVCEYPDCKKGFARQHDCK